MMIEDNLAKKDARFGGHKVASHLQFVKCAKASAVLEQLEKE